MTTELRWQDWLIALLAIVLFATPYLFGLSYETSAAWTCWVTGVLLFAFADGTLIARAPARFEFVPMVIGGLLFLAPWVLGFVAVGALAWACWIIAALTVALSSSMFLEVMGITLQERRPTIRPVGDQSRHAA